MNSVHCMAVADSFCRVMRSSSAGLCITAVQAKHAGPLTQIQRR